MAVGSGSVGSAPVGGSPATAAPSGFKAAWAINSNQIVKAKAK